MLMRTKTGSKKNISCFCNKARSKTEMEDERRNQL